jgi:SAM-dependent methyltransferase
MRGRDTDLEWERFGAIDPYFGVITDPRFHRNNLSPAIRSEFFESGRAHVDHVMEVVRRHVRGNFAPQRVLEFGCGVGRLAIPFARSSREVVGVDVSPSMLEEAARNCEALGAPSVKLVRGDDRLTAVEGEFDLVHSFIVFQHIPVARGMAILERLLERLAPGGVGALHFTYGFRRRSATLRLLVKAWVPGSNYLINLLQRRPLGTPVMQMNPYDMNAILARLSSHGIDVTHIEHTDHGGALGAFLFFTRA